MITETFLSCASACALQSSCLFWIKPIMKNQHVYGGSIKDTFNALRDNPDFFRFYRGFLPALLKSSIGRTSDITIYKYVQLYYGQSKELSSLIGGVCSSSVKVAIMPLDTISNTFQVHGKDGYKHIKGNLYRGTVAYAGVHSVNSTIWLLNYSYFKEHKPFTNENFNHMYTGLSCSLVSDLIVNPLRVIKTNKQAFSNDKSYSELISRLKGSFYRGLRMRLILNALNSSLFVLLWQNMEKQISS